MRRVMGLAGRFRFLAATVAFSAIVALPATASAATYTVTNTNDSGAGSLRQAIADANSNPGPDTVTVPAGHYVLTSGQLAVTEQLDVNGAGARSTIIDGNGASRVFSSSPGALLTLTALTVTGGQTTSSADPEGGGINAQGGLSLTDVAVTGNRTISTGGSCGDGGGIAVIAGLTLVRSTIAANTACFNAGGARVQGGNISISDSTVANNTAQHMAALELLASSGETTTIVNSTIAGNSNTTANQAYVYNSGYTLTFKNTLIANDLSNGNANCSSTGSTGHNLATDNSCGLTAAGDQSSVANPHIGALGDNGGQTDTIPLLDGSTAINAADNSGCPAVDQRGVARPQPAGGVCDIGAYEATPPAASTDAASAVTTTSATLHGTVNPTNLQTTYHFEYGTTTAYGSSTPSQAAGADYATHPELANQAGLAPNTTYHYRLVAANAVGTSFGADRTFKTAARTARRKLRLSVSPGTARAGRRTCFTFTVRSSGRVVRRATVAFAHHRMRTGANGRARLCVALSAGTHRARATKAGYRAAQARVSVRRPRPAPHFTG